MRSALLFVVLVLGVGLSFSPWVERLDLKLLDSQFQFLRSHALRPVKRDIVVVGFNEETGRTFREPMALWHPHLGRFLEAASSAGAAAIALDMVLPDHS